MQLEDAEEAWYGHDGDSYAESSLVSKIFMVGESDKRAGPHRDFDSLHRSSQKYTAQSTPSLWKRESLSRFLLLSQTTSCTLSRSAGLVIGDMGSLESIFGTSVDPFGDILVPLCGSSKSDVPSPSSANYTSALENPCHDNQNPRFRNLPALFACIAPAPHATPRRKHQHDSLLLAQSRQTRPKWPRPDTMVTILEEKFIDRFFYIV